MYIYSYKCLKSIVCLIVCLTIWLFAWLSDCLSNFPWSYLLPGDPHVVRHTGEHRGLDEKPLTPHRATATLDLSALCLARLDQLQDPFVLFLVHLEKEGDINHLSKATIV